MIVQPFALVRAGWREIGGALVFMGMLVKGYEIVKLGGFSIPQNHSCKGSVYEYCSPAIVEGSAALNDQNIAVHNGLRYVPVTYAVFFG